jgi:hypothetical protein
MVRNPNLKELREYVSKNYKFCKGNWDMYIAFFESGFNLLSENGVLCFITPDKWLGKPFGDSLREGIINHFFSLSIAGRNVFETAKVDSVITIIDSEECDNLEILGYSNGKFEFLRKIEKKNIPHPYYMDFMFSNFTEVLLKIEKDSELLNLIVTCEQACALSDAYKLKDYISEMDENTKYDPKKFFKVINTGTISKYENKWGQREMTYLGNKYLRPIVIKDKFLTNFPNTYSKKSLKSKLIIKGINLLDCSLDLAGEIIPGKTTLIVTSEEENNLLFTLGLLNSKLAFFYIREKYLASSSNTGTVFMPEMINRFPMPSKINSGIRSKIIALVKERIKVGLTIADSGNINVEIDNLVYKFYDLTFSEIETIQNY